MKRGRKVGVPNGDAVMSFSAIGAELGVSGKMASDVYRYALVKLRRNTPNTLLYLSGLADDLASERAARSTY